MLILIDLTDARTHGFEEVVLQRVLSSRQLSADDRVEAFLTTAQKEPSTEYTVFFVTLSERVTSHDDEVIALKFHERIESGLSEHQHVTVSSFRSLVSGVTETARILNQGRVEYVRLGDYASLSRPAEWDSSFIPLQEAIDILVKALAVQKTPARMSDMRLLLQKQDPRFRKVEGTSSARQGLVGDLVRKAEAQKLVLQKQQNGVDSNPVITLTSVGRRRANEIRQSGRTLPSPTSFHAAAPVVVDPPRLAKPGKLRSVSDTYIDTLRQAEMGPFQEVRWDVYDKIERIVGASPVEASDLIRDSVSAVREERDSEFEKKGKPFPWSKVRTFMYTLTSLVPVFVQEGSPFQFGWEYRSRQVDSLVADWKKALDGELVCLILRNVGPFSYGDIPALAGALYNGRGDELQDRVASIVDYLRSEGKVASDPSDPMRIIPQVIPNFQGRSVNPAFQ